MYLMYNGDGSVIRQRDVEKTAINYYLDQKKG